jgi:hypothetical protein
MIQFIQYLQPKFVKRWELNRYILPLSIDQALLNDIKKFAFKNDLNRSLFQHNGNARQFCILNQTQTNVSEKAINFRLMAYKQLGISSFKEEPMFGIFLGVNNKTGFVHQHTDPAEEGFYHTRINFLLSKPHQGGMPIINNEDFEVNEGECWLNLASEWLHSSTPVVGSKPRIVLSLGALVKKEHMHPILKEIGIE